MDMQPLVYSKKNDVLGYMTQMDYKARTVSYESAEGDTGGTTTFEDAVILHSFGEDPDGMPLYDGDIFLSHQSGNLYEAELVDGAFLQFHIVNEDLARLDSVDKYSVQQFLNILKETNTYEPLGNKYELVIEVMDDMDFDFNIKIVKEKRDGEDVYHYVGNDKHAKTVDLIKVIYMGTALLEEEEYRRVTMSHVEFENEFLNDRFQFVSPAELQSHVVSEMNKARYRTQEEPEPEEEECEDCMCGCMDSDENEDFDVAEKIEPPKDFDETVDYCNECDKESDKCECELWQKRK